MPILLPQIFRVNHLRPGKVVPMTLIGLHCEIMAEVFIEFEKLPYAVRSPAVIGDVLTAEDRCNKGCGIGRDLEVLFWVWSTDVQMTAVSIGNPGSLCSGHHRSTEFGHDAFC